MTVVDRQAVAAGGTGVRGPLAAALRLASRQRGPRPLTWVSTPTRALDPIDRFGAMIASYLDEAIDAGAIPPIDTALTGVAWFGAINEVVARWLLVDDPEPLERAYPTLRALLLRSVGVDESRIAQPSALHA